MSEKKDRLLRDGPPSSFIVTDNQTPIISSPVSVVSVENGIILQRPPRFVFTGAFLENTFLYHPDNRLRQQIPSSRTSYRNLWPGS